jgi:hypothetical protein
MTPPVIRLKAQFLDLVRQGRKRSTVRLGKRHYELGRAALVGPQGTVFVQITKLRYVSLSDLTDDDAIADGFTSRAELANTLRKIYGSLPPDAEMTVIHFEPDASSPRN